VRKRRRKLKQEIEKLNLQYDVNEERKGNKHDLKEHSIAFVSKFVFF